MIINNTELKDLGLMRLNNVLEVVPVGRSTWYEWVRLDLAPKPLNISIRMSAWKVEDIKNLLLEMTQPDWADKVRMKMNKSM